MLYIQDQHKMGYKVIAGRLISENLNNTSQIPA